MAVGDITEKLVDQVAVWLDNPEKTSPTANAIRDALTDAQVQTAQLFMNYPDYLAELSIEEVDIVLASNIFNIAAGGDLTGTPLNGTAGIRQIEDALVIVNGSPKIIKKATIAQEQLENSQLAPGVNNPVWTAWGSNIRILNGIATPTINAKYFKEPDVLGLLADTTPKDPEINSSLYTVMQYIAASQLALQKKDGGLSEGFMAKMQAQVNLLFQAYRPGTSFNLSQNA